MSEPRKHICTSQRKPLKILVACEESQAVTKQLRKLGHEAYSCDIQPCSGGHPEWHLHQDVAPLLKNTWDMIIAHRAKNRSKTFSGIAMAMAEQWAGIILKKGFITRIKSKR